MSRSDLPHLPRGLDVAGPESHFGWSLLIGTGVASPVLVAAATGRQDVPSALALYLVALVGSWFVVGLVAGAFALVAADADDAVDDDTEHDRRADDAVAASPAGATDRTEAGDPDPAATTQ